MMPDRIILFSVYKKADQPQLHQTFFIVFASKKCKTGDADENLDLE